MKEEGFSGFCLVFGTHSEIPRRFSLVRAATFSPVRLGARLRCEFLEILDVPARHTLSWSDPVPFRTSKEVNVSSKSAFPTLSPRVTKPLSFRIRPLPSRPFLPEFEGIPNEF